MDDEAAEEALMRKRHSWWLMAGAAAALVGAASIAGAQETTRPSADITPPPQLALSPPLDLRAPALTQLFSPVALQLMLVEQQETNEEEEPADVRVQSPRATPDVPRGLFRALPWAVMHPTQSWRVLTPITQ